MCKTSARSSSGLEREASPLTSIARRAAARSRLRKAAQTLAAARTLLAAGPTCADDAVNRASAAALQAARALVDAHGSPHDPFWDPEWRPGMQRRRLHHRTTSDAIQELIAEFDRVAAAAPLPPDSTQYLRTLAEDGLAADSGEMLAFQPEEARLVLDTAQRLLGIVAERLDVLDHSDDVTAPQPAVSADQEATNVDPSAATALGGLPALADLEETHLGGLPSVKPLAAPLLPFSALVPSAADPLASTAATAPVKPEGEGEAATRSASVVPSKAP